LAWVLGPVALIESKLRQVWLDQGIVCASGNTNVTLCGLTYAELEANYRTVRQAQVPSNAKPSKRARKVNPSKLPYKDAVPQLELFTTHPASKPLGWKNLTIKAKLVRDVDSFAQGEEVFVKFREVEASIDCLIHGYKVLAKLGLPFLRATKINCVLDRKVWEHHISLAPSEHQNMLKRAVEYKKGPEDGSGPVLIASWFEGGLPLHDKVALPDDDPRLHTDTFAWDLLRVMIVNKWLGHGDLNEHNLMVGEDGHVLRIDMSFLPPSRITGVGFKGKQVRRWCVWF